MSTKDTCGPVPFPFDAIPQMMLRDYFAAQAMQGTLANPGEREGAAAVADWSYRMADAMLAERAKE